MDLARKLELLEEQILAANDGMPSDLQDWKGQAEVVIRTVMGAESPLYKRFNSVSYSPMVIGPGTDFAPYRRSGVQNAVKILKAAKRELELIEESKSALAQVVEDIVEVEDKGSVDPNGRVFVVHGHDDAKKHELARFLQKLVGQDPVILHEQSNKGAVLIEKLENSAAGTGFAVILLTADDLGRAKNDIEEKPRGRQNVVFEMGFFMGALGRSNVAVLLEDGVEAPGDVQGLVYTPLDVSGAWKTVLAREVEDAGYSVNWKALR
ncbi:TIR domain-containing protein [Arthrobacter sp. SX1312]|uniref:TIR domain-containing protein n=1 Tax=Arthrobacter sp. SX1312 TaxID=2058896 RepID=UPI0015E1F4D0|nr:nucleotide-binding protein [Arthrobacter sp. SX1312]